MTTTGQHTSEVEQLWHSSDEAAWEHALERYRQYVKPTHVAIESEMEALQPDTVRHLDADQWYDWLLNKYFVWKYTAPNRYATTTGHLKRQAAVYGKQHLLTLRDRVLASGESSIQDALRVATQFKGLGPAGGSGLLALLFPTRFGTVDQFAVRALRKVRSLPEHELLASMNPESLMINDGVVLIGIMQRKANELNQKFVTDRWSPRRVDKILWASERECVEQWPCLTHRRSRGVSPAANRQEVSRRQR